MTNITVSFLGEEYSFPADLQEFVRILQYFDSFNNELNPLLLNLMKNSEWKDGTENGLEYFKNPMISLANKVIAKLSEYSIYDVTISDLVDNNPGYINLKEIGNNTLDGMKKILSNSITEWIEGYDSAQAKAASKVTGMGFSIWTSSLTSALVYSAMEASTVKKQQTKAQQEYQNEIKKLNLATNKRSKKQENELLVNYYYPGVADSLYQFISSMMSVYIEKLDCNGFINIESVKEFNMQRSSDLLKNISIIDDKKALLKEAFSYCPFNKDVYITIIDLNYEDEFFTDAVEQFLLKNAIITYYETLIQPIDYPNDISKYIDENQTHIKALAELKGISDKNIYDQITEEYRKTVKEKYRFLDSIISQNNSKLLFEDFTDDEIINCDDDKLKTYSEITVDKIISVSSFDTLVNKCGYTEFINDILPKNNSACFYSKEEIDNYYITEIYKLLSKELAREKDFRKERIDSSIAESINNREKKYKAARKHKIQISAAIIVLSIMIVIPIIINYLLVSFQNKEIEKQILNIVVENYKNNSSDTYIKEYEITDEISVNSISYYKYKKNKSLIIPEIELHTNSSNIDVFSMELVFNELFSIPSYEKKISDKFIVINNQANFRVIQNGNTVRSFKNSSMESSFAKLNYNPYFSKWKVILFVLYLIMLVKYAIKIKRRFEQ